MIAQSARNAERDPWVTRHQLLSFFALAYAINIAAQLALSFLPIVPSGILWFMQITSPTTSALVLTGVIGGKEAIRKLLLRLVQWRVGLVWYFAAFALLWIPLLAALVYSALGFPTDGLRPGATPLFLLGQVAVTLFAGPLVEETGWRGFALPRLQERHSALTSSLILGVLWACWHLPFYGSGGGVGIPFPAYLALVTVLTTYMTWIYNNTRGSLLLCVLAHFCFNAASAFVAGYLGLLPQMVFNIVCSVGLTGIVVAIVLYFGPQTMTGRKRLSTVQ